VHIRVLALDPELRPVAGNAVVEALDAKSIRIFRKVVTLDDFGIASLDLPLSTEPNLGVWKLLATAGDRSAQLDVRVERYVLPKYEVRVELESGWELASERISGRIAAEYAFGKPVDGVAEVIASRYAGVWEEYARITQPINGGSTTFELPPVEFVAGSPESGGLGQVQIEAVVREQATGYEERTTELVTIASTPIAPRIIPESNTFKPTLPLALLLVAESPDGEPIDADVTVNLNWQDDEFNGAGTDTERVQVRGGIGTLQVTPPDDAAMLSLDASTDAEGGAWTYLTLRAGYSPSNTFIHITQAARSSSGPLAVGDTARFNVAATREASNFYYEVIGRGKVVFSDVSQSPDIDITLTPLMAPAARLLVYQILPGGEVAADYLPFSVTGDYPHAVSIEMAVEEVRPGAELDVSVQTQGAARVGLAAVDRSVFILAENRLNLQQVFDELERLSLLPQAELHEAEGGMGDVDMRMPMGDIGFGGGFDPYSGGTIPGAKELFEEAGVVVITNRRVPEGKDIQSNMMFAANAAGGGDDDSADEESAAVPASGQAAPTDGTNNNATSLAEVQRVRQFFPETWLWSDLTTDDAGRATERVTAPDSITTWMFRAVGLSKEHGLGIGEAELRVFQPFFVAVDVPFSAIRGEELPVAVALYNYGSESDTYEVTLTPGDWFDLLDSDTQTVTVGPSEVGLASFPIRATTLGVGKLEISARGSREADAIIKELLVEPEGVGREEVENLVLTPGEERSVTLAIPDDAIDGSGRAFVAITGNVLAQTIDGLESLLQMPYGCGEQNMLLFAPDVFVTRYLRATNQLKPEIVAKAETLMLTGYQRELTYWRDDGSFSAFGESDPEGSLWLSAFVLKTFAQAQDVIYVDDTVLTTTADWIRGQRKADGSYAMVGFVHHAELFGGLSGNVALTAFVAVALHEAGDADGARSAAEYLEGQLDDLDDDYAIALVAYALGLTGSGRAADAITMLVDRAQESPEGIHWGDSIMPLAEDGEGLGDEPILPGKPGPQPPDGVASAAIEMTGYAALALLTADDKLNASSAIRWLAAQRNSSGGFGSTQDTIVALQAMTTAASDARDDIDATVFLMVEDWSRDVQINAENADILQVFEVPAGGDLTIETSGNGQVMGQAVRRYNLPDATDADQSIFELTVEYSAAEVEVDDTIDVIASIRFTPPEAMPMQAGMIVMDVAIPTGFAPVEATIDALLTSEPQLKRWDLAGRKVILYIEDMEPGESLTFTFEARALYPVRAQPVASQAYAYYKPQWRGESLGGRLVVA